MDAAAAGLEPNRKLLSEAQQRLAQLLLDCNQAHLFAHWPAPGTDDALKRGLLDQLGAVEAAYPGGVVAYYNKAKELLQASLKGANPFEGFVPSVPDGERLVFGNERFHALEKAGREQFHTLGFILVAGGLGERLGYKGIKVALPTELTSGTCYLELYIKNILAIQGAARRAGHKGCVLPLAIMTSDDTHAATAALLEERRNFGMAPDQITLMKQEKVPALSGNDAAFALQTDGPAAGYRIQTKPHGHGDVHVLMHLSGTAASWQKKYGTRWVLFFQDTNALAFRALPSALGVSIEKGFAMNSVTVPRKPGQALGGIARLTKGDTSITVNVEYNQLGPLLESTGDGKGDVADATGFSPYPGNINCLLLRLDTYIDVLNKSNGLMPEFVNPKYKDAEKTTFKKPTRIECMMQDYPRLLTTDQKVGMTQADRWYAMEPVKNNIKDAAIKQQKSGSAESGASGEAFMYYNARELLRCAKVSVPEDTTKVYQGITVPYGPRVVLAPAFGVTLQEVQGHVKGRAGGIALSAESSLLLDGDIDLYNLDLDGALTIRAVPGAKVTVKNLTVKNEGWRFAEIDPEDPTIDQKYQIRGYVLDRRDQLELNFPVPGAYVVDDSVPLSTRKTSIGDV